VRFSLLNIGENEQLEPLQFTEVYWRLHSFIFHTSHAQCCFLPIYRPRSQNDLRATRSRAIPTRTDTTHNNHFNYCTSREIIFCF